MAFNAEAGGKIYSTKKSLQEELRRILYLYSEYETIRGDDHQTLLSIIAWHPDAELKVGCGIHRFFVKRNELYPTPGFWIERTDGTSTDFSFYHCLSPKNACHDLMGALRDEVADQVREFKINTLENGECRCPFTNEVLYWGYSHVDHVIPFEIMAKTFLRESALDPEKVVVGGFEDGSVTKRLEDADLSLKWRTYHKNNAVLRLTSPTGNLSIARKQWNGYKKTIKESVKT